MKTKWPKHIPHSSDKWNQVAELFEKGENISDFICNIFLINLKLYESIDCLLPIAQEKFGARKDIHYAESWWPRENKAIRIKFCRAVARVQKRRENKVDTLQEIHSQFHA